MSTVTPMRGNTLVAREYVPPYNSLDTTIRSPTRTCAAKTEWIAAIPEANPNAASVPSRAAICDSNAATVGFP